MVLPAIRFFNLKRASLTRDLGSHGEVPHLLTRRLQAEDGAASLLHSWSHCTHRSNSWFKQTQSSAPVHGPRFQHPGSRPCTHRWNSHVQQMQSSAPVCGRDAGEPTRVAYSADGSGARAPRPVRAARAACASRLPGSPPACVARPVCAVRRVRGTSPSGRCCSAAILRLRERALGGIAAEDLSDSG